MAKPRVLLTGGTSFTGVWIARALAAAGIEIVATSPRARDDYVGVRRDRLVELSKVAETTFKTPFGSDAFIEVIKQAAPLNLMIHHGAHVSRYREPDFDPVHALGVNTLNAGAVMATLRSSGATALISTGTVFEAGEGGDSASAAVTPYGLSKTLTTAALQYWSGEAGLTHSRVVVPNPFGPLEEPRFCWSAFCAWFADEAIVVRAPDYVRDHIPVSALAQSYLKLTEAMIAGGEAAVLRPSGWCVTQAEFAKRLSEAAAPRLGRPCRVVLAKQDRFDEPRTRVNSEIFGGDGPDPSENFWRHYIQWYVEMNARGEFL